MTTQHIASLEAAARAPMWTPDEIEFVQANLDQPDWWLGIALRRSRYAVCEFRRYHGIRKRTRERLRKCAGP